MKGLILIMDGMGDRPIKELILLGDIYERSYFNYGWYG